MKSESAKILVIDDEEVICKGCRLILSDQGHSVESHMKGRAGLGAIREGQFDVVLLDMKLPDMDGMEILRAAREEKPSLYVIVMTGYSTVQNAVEAMKLGAIDYISKPFSDDELVLAVARALEKKRLLEENIYLRKELLDRFRFSNIVGENPKVLVIFDQIRKVAPTDSTVLIYGESGTGKELFSRAIHAHSQRAGRQFVAVDCSTLAPNLLESELFGHVKGAFTGATQDKAGIFEMAHDGTLFLDDVANLTLEIQGKLLRVLEECEYKPVGASHVKKTNVRIIAATNKELRAMVDEGTFREDLFYRLNVFPIFLPPLQHRKDDIPKLAYHFLRHFCRKTGKRIEGFSDDALEILVNHEWPGNVRQLKNVVERLVIMADRDILDSLDLLEPIQMKGFLKGDSIPKTLEELRAVKRQLLEDNYGQLEKAFLLKALKTCEGNITHAAEKVGMQRSNFSSLMKKHRISTKPTKAESD
ncbi:MAG: sigma-54-dependent Fis family transcriptional regulator [Deltaproteobacteria bacterium]|nr:MAG: sigma-54-dependent Fis family transcriptional regulator [Deltaproteobacteria bacterium]